jgi:hypothetical protein
MKVQLLSILFLFVSFNYNAQKTVPFVDFNHYFQSYQNGAFRMVEMQRIIDYKGGDEFVAYIDNKGNLRLFDGQEIQDITNLNVEYQVSDHLMTWRVGPTLNLWDNKKQQTLTFNVGEYQVRDSIVVFQDLRYNTVRVYWKGELFNLYTVVDQLNMPEFIGENIVAFKDNGDYYKIFWNGKIYNLGVWNGKIDFQAGTDIATFNDPTMRTYAVFENGEFLDVEKFYMKNYRAGRGFIVYEDLNNNLIYYKSGEKKTLTYFAAQFWDVKDDLVIWEENSYVYCLYKGEKIQVCNYIPEEYQLKNGVFAFKNILGGASAFVNGEIKEITNQEMVSLNIYGSDVIVQLFNNTFLILDGGKVHSL